MEGKIFAPVKLLDGNIVSEVTYSVLSMVLNLTITDYMLSATR